MRKAAILFVLASCASSASAQTSQCMSMGPDMVNCQNSNGSTTNCMAMGGTMATCTTSGGARQYQGDGGATQLGEGLASFISRMKERSLRAKIGKMIASGVCEGAAKYALSKGRLDLGKAIGDGCGHASMGQGQNQRLEDALSEIAENAQTPAPMSAGVTLTKVDARGTQLLLTAVVGSHESISPSDRSELAAALCSENRMITLIRAGASVRTVVLDPQGEVGSQALVAAKECGIE